MRSGGVWCAKERSAHSRGAKPGSPARRALNRSMRKAPPTLAFTTLEINLLRRPGQSPPDPISALSLNECVTRLAKLGGYLARASDGPPREHGHLARHVAPHRYRDRLPPRLSRCSHLWVNESRSEPPRWRARRLISPKVGLRVQAVMTSTRKSAASGRLVFQGELHPKLREVRAERFRRAYCE